RPIFIDLKITGNEVAHGKSNLFRDDVLQLPALELQLFFDHTLRGLRFVSRPSLITAETPKSHAQFTQLSRKATPIPPLSRPFAESLSLLVELFRRARNYSL